jgi:hypothetical protein
MSRKTYEYQGTETSSEQYASEWDTVADTEPIVVDTNEADDAFMDLTFKDEEGNIEKLKVDVENDRERLQELAVTYCNDSEKTLTSGELRVAPSNHIPREELRIAYIQLTEQELNLIESEDALDKSPQRKKANEIVSSYNPYDLGTAISREVIGVFRALDNYNRAGDRGLVRGWFDHQEAKNELKKYGYNPKGPQTEVFSLILQQAKAIRYGIPTKDTQVDDMLGRKRACDFQETMILLDDEATAENCRRALKKAGYKKLPESWKDENFSTSDIAEICRIARESAA